MGEKVFVNYDITTRTILSFHSSKAIESLQTLPSQCSTLSSNQSTLNGIAPRSRPNSRPNSRHRKSHKLPKG